MQVFMISQIEVFHLSIFSHLDGMDFLSKVRGEKISLNVGVKCDQCNNSSAVAGFCAYS